MKPILTAAETQALDRASEARGISIETLMERAGHAVARSAGALAGGASGRRVLVLAGKGNNGGDGFVAARRLAGWGAAATVVLFADPGAVRGPAAANLQRARAAGVRLLSYDRASLLRETERSDVAVDALFGSGFRGSVEGAYAEAIDLLNADEIPVVAVDVPSGVEGDSGAVRGPAVWADVTVTFGAARVGDVMLPGAERAGLVEIVDIGFPPDLLRSELLLVEAEDVLDLLPERALDAHKRRVGVVLVVAGSRRMTGAPDLVARGAYRMGAGLVTVAAPEGALPAVQASLSEATFVPLAEGPEGSVAERAWTDLSERLGGFDAIAIGPGLSTEGEAPAFVRRLVRHAPVPVVADADALNAFSGRAQDLAANRPGLVLTPHEGEFARLFGMSVEELRAERVGLVRKAAVETDAVVLLKGPRTLVAAPETDVRITATGTPVLATGGTGDVLTGAIAALVARGCVPFDAASAGAYVHGLAGRVAQERYGDGTVSTDVADALPEAVRRLRDGIWP